MGSVLMMNHPSLRDLLRRFPRRSRQDHRLNRLILSLPRSRYRRIMMNRSDAPRFIRTRLASKEVLDFVTDAGVHSDGFLGFDADLRFGGDDVGSSEGRDGGIFGVLVGDHSDRLGERCDKLFVCLLQGEWRGLHPPCSEPRLYTSSPARLNAGEYPTPLFLTSVQLRIRHIQAQIAIN